MKKPPEKDTDLNAEKDAELFDYLKAETEKTKPEKDLLNKVRRKISQLDAEYIDDTIKVMNGQDYNFIVNPYPLGDVYEILNRDGYDLIRDGFITIGGEASSGKTSFINDLAIDILQRTTETCFLFYSLDDSVPITGKRIISQLNRENLFREKIDNHLKMKPHADLLKRIAIRDSITIARLEREAERLKLITGCNKIIIGIDYLQAIPAPADYGGDRRQLFNDNLKALKEKQIAIQEAGGCILFCLSQMNRDTKADGYRYRETSEIENQSDVCIDIELPRTTQGTGKDKRTVPDRETDNRIIRVQKNKMGKRGMTFFTSITSAFNFTRLDFAQDNGAGYEADSITADSEDESDNYKRKLR